VGNGDPTERKAFSGYCMAIAQASKTAGDITVEATSPGLASASVTLPAKSVALRAQVPVWEREVPKGSGITGLWRPVPGGETTGLMSFLVGNGVTVFTLRQDGSTLSGSVEGSGGGFFGGSDAPIPITEGKVNGDDISFKSGNSTYTGKINGDQLELERKIQIPFRMTPPAELSGPRPAIGPPPDGSDPSFNMPRHIPQGISVVLRRVER
jgi:beta-galactosidase